MNWYNSLNQVKTFISKNFHKNERSIISLYKLPKRKPYGNSLSVCVRVFACVCLNLCVLCVHGCESFYFIS